MTGKTKLKLINEGLSKAKEPIFHSDVEALKTEIGRKAYSAYDSAVEELLMSFPWPFALKRARLDRSAQVPLTTWSYYYEYPENYLQDFDVYVRDPNFVFPTQYDFSLYSGYVDNEQYTDAVTEEGFVATNYTELFMLYTSKDVQVEDFPVTFERTIINEVAEEITFRTPVEALEKAQREKRFKGKRNKAKVMQSKTLPRYESIGSSRMTRRIRGY